jgi:very-short-patch-repair endonuclease
MGDTKELEEELTNILKNSYISKKARDSIAATIVVLMDEYNFTKKEKKQTKELNKHIVSGKLDADKKEKIRELKTLVLDIIKNAPVEESSEEEYSGDGKDKSKKGRKDEVISDSEDYSENGTESDTIIDNDIQTDVDDIINSLDLLVKEYSKYTDKHPMKYVTYDKTNNKYVVKLLDKSKKLYSNKNSACKIALEHLINSYKKNNIMYIPNIIKRSNTNDSIQYIYDNVIYYDLNHILLLLQMKHSYISKLYAEYEKYIIAICINKNVYNGYIIRPLISIDTVKKIFYRRRTVGIENFAKANNIDIYNVHFMYKESSTISCIIKSFNGEKHITQHWIKPYRVDLLFVNYNLIIECDENGHKDRDYKAEHKRQLYLEKKSYTIIRYNPDGVDFSIFEVICQIRNFMNKINELKYKYMYKRIDRDINDSNNNKDSKIAELNNIKDLKKMELDQELDTRKLDQEIAMRKLDHELAIKNLEREKEKEDHEYRMANIKANKKTKKKRTG